MEQTNEWAEGRRYMAAQRSSPRLDACATPIPTLTSQRCDRGGVGTGRAGSA